MAKTRKEKKVLLEQYKKLLSESKGLILTKPTGVTPNEINEFRKEIFDFGSNYTQVKNTIFQIALKETNFPEMSDLENGEHAVVFLKEDIVSPSKALKKFVDSAKTAAGDVKVQIVAGLLDGALLSKSQVTELADMPSFEGSISMILGVIESSISGILSVIEDPISSYGSVLDQAFKK